MFKVLIVDDNITSQRVLEKMIQRENRSLIILKASDGKSALDVAYREVPELIFLDVVMPVLDGFEVCHRLKSDERLCRIPVVMISSLDGKTEKERAFEAGAMEYVAKPFQDRRIVEVSNRVFDKE